MMNAEIENREYHNGFMREAIEMVSPISITLIPENSSIKAPPNAIRCSYDNL